MASEKNDVRRAREGCPSWRRGTALHSRITQSGLNPSRILLNLTPSQNNNNNDNNLLHLWRKSNFLQYSLLRIVYVILSRLKYQNDHFNVVSFASF